MKILLDELKNIPSSRGNSLLKKYLNGETLTSLQSIHAKCSNCMGYFVDGKVDCKIPICPLYPFMAYNKNKRKVNRGKGSRKV